VPEPNHVYEEMLATRADRAVDAARERLWIAVRTVAVCLLWQALGFAVMVWALRVHDPVNGPLAMRGGAGIATVGTLLTLVVSQLRQRKRGD